MSMPAEVKERLLLPRWLTFQNAVKLGETHPDAELSLPATTSFFDKIRDWTIYRELPYAIDLVGTALLVDFRDAIVEEAARFILDQNNREMNLAEELARTYLGIIGVDQWGEKNNDGLSLCAQKAKGKLGALRALSKQYDRNPILWCDLAYYHALLGHDKKSERCMEVALGLAHENRFILRAATRCFLHVGDHEKALYHLRRSQLAKIDPWLLSTEIATGEALQKRSKNIKLAQSILHSQSFSPRSLSELAGTIGTIELREGAKKKSKKLFIQSLIDPNENAAAQAEWVNKDLDFTLPPIAKDIPCRYEADSRILYREKDYEASLEKANQWLLFQPFSSRPALFASYIAAVCLEDYHAAIDIINETKQFSPHNPTLSNNLAFALASLDRVDEAKIALFSVDPETLDPTDKSIFAATYGLINYRSGEREEGKALYETAVNNFKKLKDLQRAALALFFWGREERRLAGEGDAILKESIELGKSQNLFEIQDRALLLLGHK